MVECTHYHWTHCYERLSINNGPSMFMAYCCRCQQSSGWHFSRLDAERAMPKAQLRKQGGLLAHVTPGFKPPEHYWEIPEADGHVDIFTLGDADDRQ
jgi:hypothetical protein